MGGRDSHVSEQYPDGAAQAATSASDDVFAVVVNTLGRMANGIAVLFVLALAAVFIYEIIARVAFNRPTGFANQLSAYGMPFIAYLAAARTLACNGHVTVDFFVEKLQPSTRAELQIATDAFSVALLAVITYIASAVVFESWQSGYRAFSTSFTFPEYLAQAVMPLGLFLLTLEQIVRLLTSVRERSRQPSGAGGVAQ